MNQMKYFMEENGKNQRFYCFLIEKNHAIEKHVITLPFQILPYLETKTLIAI